MGGVIDGRLHLKHADVAGTEWSADSLIELMDDAGIAQAVVFAMATTTQRSIQLAERALLRYPDRLLPFAYALPSYERPVLDDIESAITERGFHGIVMHAAECGLAENVIRPVFELASYYDVPCMIDFVGNFCVAERIAHGFHDVKFIISHMGQYLCTNPGTVDRFIHLAQAHPNVYLDLSAVVDDTMIVDAAERIGSDRLIFGTDGPFAEPDTLSFAQRAIDRILGLELSNNEKSDIFGGTIAELLHIDEAEPQPATAELETALPPEIVTEDLEPRMAAHRHVEKKDIVAGLRDVGIREGDIVFVHSSLSAFGYVVGGAAAVIDALIEATGPEGTVVMPTFTWTHFHDKNHVVFDVSNTPCESGRIPEVFRNRPEVLRSWHVCHSVAARGMNAEDAMGEGVSSFGAGSSFHQLYELNSWNLLLGVGFESCSALHMAEEFMKVPYRWHRDFSGSTVILRDGTRVPATSIEFLRYEGYENDSKP
ncbi:MAG: aminoglycoside 3-N-acetyltransferase [Candidatus Hydrogenedentes bacterium]|nr:aminoglycoside 3-N-acetyltransferase [Candidatus Hydrogenedentota bacterium]